MAGKGKWCVICAMVAIAIVGTYAYTWHEFRPLKEEYYNWLYEENLQYGVSIFEHNYESLEEYIVCVPAPTWNVWLDVSKFTTEDKWKARFYEERGYKVEKIDGTKNIIESEAIGEWVVGFPIAIKDPKELETYTQIEVSKCEYCNVSEPRVYHKDGVYYIYSRQEIEKRNYKHCDTYHIYKIRLYPIVGVFQKGDCYEYN